MKSFANLRRENNRVRLDREILKKGRDLVCEGPLVNVEKIDELAELLPIQAVFDTLEISRSAVYERRKRALKGEVRPRRKTDNEHAIVILKIHKKAPYSIRVRCS